MLITDPLFARAYFLFSNLFLFARHVSMKTIYFLNMVRTLDVDDGEKDLVNQSRDF
jgi:hypothetical protein